MKYFLAEPEASRDTTEDTDWDNSVEPPALSNIKYEFEFWDGDHLLYCYPIYLISEAAANAWTAAGLTGARFESIPIAKSDVFEDDHPEITMPLFLLLVPTGAPGQDDLGAVADGSIVMSERAIAVVTNFGMENATLEPYEPD